jgi:uncharacterized membrane protein YozB (DUF420 family)
VLLLCVIFVVLMMFWLFAGYAGRPGQPSPPGWAPLATTIIPWLCVAVLGWIVFGGPLGPRPGW